MEDKEEKGFEIYQGKRVTSMCASIPWNTITLLCRSVTVVRRKADMGKAYKSNRPLRSWWHFRGCGEHWHRRMEREKHVWCAFVVVVQFDPKKGWRKAKYGPISFILDKIILLRVGISAPL